MKKTIRLYWQEACAFFVPSVEQTLADNFPLAVMPAGVKEPARQSFDTTRGQYDALYLLRELHEAGKNDAPFALWLVGEDISSFGYDFLYGASLGNAAVVSAARAGYGENLHKEICHEAGHLFGLEHCINSCAMNTASNQRQLFEKPLKFCAGCKEYLLEEDLR